MMCPARQHRQPPANVKLENAGSDRQNLPKSHGQMDKIVPYPHMDLPMVCFTFYHGHYFLDWICLKKIVLLPNRYQTCLMRAV